MPATEPEPEPSRTSPTQQLNIRIDHDLRDRLGALAKARYTSVSALVREGILLLLETDPKGVLPNNLAGPVLTKAIELGELLVTRTPEQGHEPLDYPPRPPEPVTAPPRPAPAPAPEAVTTSSSDSTSTSSVSWSG
tara:strand:+ start:1662 stop:2069 length:408 start_codon:yes stop_codon:yes gene_type:complete